MENFSNSRRHFDVDMAINYLDAVHTHAVKNPDLLAVDEARVGQLVDSILDILEGKYSNGEAGAALIYILSTMSQSFAIFTPSPEDLAAVQSEIDARAKASGEGN